VERSEPTLDGERRANLLLTVKLTFVGAKDILEAGAFLEMVRQ
jgi:hypothetical protein